MLKRLLVGLVLGTFVGALVAGVIVQGLGIAVIHTGPELESHILFMYLAAAITGVITGLVAGKPIWSADGKIEATLKAFFGVLLGLGGMFALRTWANVHIDLSMFKAGIGSLGELPAASLPLLAAVLAGVYEIDNSPNEDIEKKAKDLATSPGARKNVRVAANQAERPDDDVIDEPVAKKKAR